MASKIGFILSFGENGLRNADAIRPADVKLCHLSYCQEALAFDAAQGLFQVHLPPAKALQQLSQVLLHSP